eukprot:912024-Amphidinium_carterae.1
MARLSMGAKEHLNPNSGENDMLGPSDGGAVQDEMQLQTQGVDLDLGSFNLSETSATSSMLCRSTSSKHALSA